jgi:hypothetical protein
MLGVRYSTPLQPCSLFPSTYHDIDKPYGITISLPPYYWKQLENKQEMKVSKFMKWNNCIIRILQRLYVSNATITKLWLATTNKG